MILFLCIVFYASLGVLFGGLLVLVINPKDWQVRYPNDKLSPPLTWAKAEKLAEECGGEVIPKMNYNL